MKETTMLTIADARDEKINVNISTKRFKRILWLLGLLPIRKDTDVIVIKRR